MKNWKNIENVYLIGIGGIGMSALARYFRSQGKNVAGYDRTPTTLIEQLIQEGMIIHHQDNVEMIPATFKDPETTLVIYTPAVSNEHSELLYYQNKGFNVMKRSEVLGKITAEKFAIAIAGTHGKTTTTTMVAHAMHLSTMGCNAFLGGISKNYDSNLILSKKSKYVVVEADEFDRSFLQLTPSLAVVTSIDAEHLDIYGTKEGMQTAYHDFVKKIVRGGKLIYKKEINMPTIGINNIEKFTYSILTEKADFCIRNLRQDNGLYTYDFMTPSGVIEDLKLGLPGIMNVENSVAAMSAAYLLGVDTAIIRKALDSFQGAKRRFDYQIHSEKMVYIDDYAHHPEELKACITSARNIFKNKKITGIFQPHLFTRTRDFAPEFAESLSLLDEVYLLDIYPAREKPIKGVTSEIIFDKIRTKEKKMCSMDELLADIEKNDFEVLITMGAGNIDKLTLPIKEILMEKLNA